MIEEMIRGATQLTQLVDDVVDTSKIERGGLEFELGDVDLCALLAESVESIAATAPCHRLVTHLPVDRIIIRGDAARLRQVVFNLLSNAVRYSPGGGTIVVRAVLVDRQVQVSVSDDGIGLAPEHVERVFERFFRAQSPVMHERPGIGLGLPISRYIVEAHGGKIWAESPGHGKGSTFYFTIPQPAV